MNAADYGLMSSFELIDRINGTISWADEENEPCMKELCDRYNIDFDAYDDYEILWDQIIREVYDDVIVVHQYSINNRDYAIVFMDSDDYSEYAVVDNISHRVMFEVYEIGSMRDCKNYIKERIDID